jgi:predicted RNA polymerase sigma factor
VPAADELSQRLAGVLAVIYLLFNEGYLCSAGEVPQRRDLTDDAEWLAALLARLMPAEPEVLGLLALIRLHRARAASRFDAAGRLVLLRHQDRARWDHAEIAAAADLVIRAAQLLGRVLIRSRPPSSPAMPKRRAGTPPTGCRSCCCTTRCYATCPRR